LNQNETKQKIQPKQATNLTPTAYCLPTAGVAKANQSQVI